MKVRLQRIATIVANCQPVMGRECLNRNLKILGEKWQIFEKNSSDMRSTRSKCVGDTAKSCCAQLRDKCSVLDTTIIALYRLKAKKCGFAAQC